MKKIYLASIKKKSEQRPVLIAFPCPCLLAEYCNSLGDSIEGYSVQFVEFKDLDEVEKEINYDKNP